MSRNEPSRRPEVPAQRLFVSSLVLAVSLVACGARTSLPPPVLDMTPRQLAPLSTSRVTSRRPTLHWALPASAAEATVDLCLDRACNEPIGVPALVEGTSFAPASDLPTGVVYWRLHPDKDTDLTSPTWEFTVGATTAPVDTSWGTTLDVNGDGYADLVVGADLTSDDTGAVYVYLGGPDGLATSPATTLTGPDGVQDSFGNSVASAGDVNGDGYADLVVGAGVVLDGARVVGDVSVIGHAYVYLGSPTGLATSPATTLTGSVNGAFGISVASAGDVNGDGYADLLVGEPSLDSDAHAMEAEVDVYLGSATGIATTPTTVLTISDGLVENFGHSVAGAGDVNGDGYADVVVGADGFTLGTGMVYLYFGGPTGLTNAPAATLAGFDDHGAFGFIVASAGDVNGDGYADLVVGAPAAMTDSGAAYLYLGGPTGPGMLPTAVLSNLDGPNAGFGYCVASAGDVNGDGYGDLVIGDNNGGSVNNDGDRVHVYLGSASGLSAAPATTLIDPQGERSAFFGNAVAGAGDENGDGYADLVVGDPIVVGIPGAAIGQKVYVYAGSPSGIRDVPVTTLSNSGGSAGEYFGVYVFGASD